MGILNRSIRRADLPPLAVIGCGAAASQFCLPVLSKYPGFRESVILVDRDLDQVRSVASKFGIPKYSTDYRSVSDNIRAAVIMTPHHLHAEQSIHFLRRCQHVFVEKPLGMTEAEVKCMLETASSTQSVLMVNNYRRLFPSYCRVRDLIFGESFGKLLRVTIRDGDEFSWDSVSSFYLRDPQAKGVLLDRGAHTLDVLCWWLGAVPIVTTARIDTDGGIEGLADVVLSWRETVIDLKFSRFNRLQNTYTIEFEKGTIWGRLFDPSRLWILRQGEPEMVTCRPTLFQECAWRLMENFIRVVQGLESPLFSAQDVAPSISIIGNAYQQAVSYRRPWYQEDPNISYLRQQQAGEGSADLSSDKIREDVI